MAWLWTLSLNGALGLGGYWAARHAFRQPAGLPRALAAATIAWAWATLGLQILGTLGHLQRGPLLAWTVAGLLVALGFRLARPRGDDGERPKEESRRWDAPATICVGLTIWVCLVVGVPGLMLPVKVVSDGPIYHLYFAVRWWKAGALFPIAAPFGESAAAYFPANGDLWFTWLTAGWGGDRLARIGQSPFLLIAALAAYATARRLGVGAPAAVVAVCCFATNMPMLLFSFQPNVDTIFVAGYLIAFHFFLRYALRDGGAETLALGGIAAGGALGTKPTAVVFIPPLLAVAGILVLARRGEPWRTRLAHLAILGVTPLVMSGYWLGRGVWLAGNPLYPAHVTVFGRVLFRGWYPASAMKYSPFYIPISRVDALADVLLTVADPRLTPLWLAAILWVWAIGRPRGPLDRWVGLCTALAVLNVALYWLVIPYRTQQRFMLQGFGLAVVPLGCLLDRARWLRWAGAALLAAHLLTPQSWPIDARVSGLVPHAPAASISFPISPDRPWQVLADPALLLYCLGLLGVGLGSLAVAWSWSRVASRPGPWTWLGAVASSLAAASLVGLAVEGAFRASRVGYPSFDYLPAWMALESLSPPGGARVAYAGTNIPYYLFGKDLRNEVRYANVDGRPGWLMHDYWVRARERGEPDLWDTPRPGWDRVHPDERGWLEALRREGIDLLVVARAKREDGMFNTTGGQDFPIERRWAESRPEWFTPVYGVRPPDREVKIFRVHFPENATDPRAGRN